MRHHTSFYYRLFALWTLLLAVGCRTSIQWAETQPRLTVTQSDGNSRRHLDSCATDTARLVYSAETHAKPDKKQNKYKTIHLLPVKRLLLTTVRTVKHAACQIPHEQKNGGASEKASGECGCGGGLAYMLLAAMLALNIGIATSVGGMFISFLILVPTVAAILAGFIKGRWYKLQPLTDEYDSRAEQILRKHLNRRALWLFLLGVFLFLVCMLFWVYFQWGGYVAEWVLIVLFSGMILGYSTFGYALSLWLGLLARTGRDMYHYNKPEKM